MRRNKNGPREWLTRNLTLRRALLSQARFRLSLRFCSGTTPRNPLLGGCGVLRAGPSPPLLLSALTPSRVSSNRCDELRRPACLGPTLPGPRLCPRHVFSPLRRGRWIDIPLLEDTAWSVADNVFSRREPDLPECCSDRQELLSTVSASRPGVKCMLIPPRRRTQITEQACWGAEGGTPQAIRSPMFQRPPKKRASQVAQW